MWMSSSPELTRCRCCGGAVSNQAKVCPHCGQPDPAQSPQWQLEAMELSRQGRPIDAIKLVRENTQLGLKEAKDLVESWNR
jgi:ribosomal protein L7/L12